MASLSTVCDKIVKTRIKCEKKTQNKKKNNKANKPKKKAKEVNNLLPKQKIKLEKKNKEALTQDYNPGR